MFRSLSRILLLLVTVSLTLTIPLAPAADAADSRLKLLGQFTYPRKADYRGTTVGGLSGITFDRKRNVYYAISDDRSEFQPARFYTLQIDVSLQGIKDVRVVGVTTLDSDGATPGIQPYAKNDIDAEEILLLANDELIISSERDVNGRPWIRRFKLDGSLIGDLPLPDRYLPATSPGPDGKPAQVRGVRSNLGHEALTIWPNGITLFAMNEEALAQDGPIATSDSGTVVRMQRFDLGPSGWQAGVEGAYRVEKISKQPRPADAFADNGVTAMLPVQHLWPEFDLLVMERSYSTGVGNDVVIYGVDFRQTVRTERMDALAQPYTRAVAKKTQLARMAEIGVTPDNLEGMTYGPALPNGSPSLIVMSDDNFSVFDPPQVNQFLLFELRETRQAGTAVSPAAQPAQPVRPPAPAQLPAALPRTGELPIDLSIFALGAAIAALGIRLRRR